VAGFVKTLLPVERSEYRHPPLRERKEVPIFIEYFLDKFGKKYRKGLNLCRVPLNTLIPLAGNVRELENIIQRYVLLGNGEGIIEELNHMVNHQKKQEDRRMPFFEGDPS
jgi:transcriptional regulator with GAF, ATPase, and Fis domain